MPRASLRARGCAALSCIFLVFGAAPALAQPLVQPLPPPPAPVEEVDDPGFFEIRSAVAELRGRDGIDDGVLRTMERELDLEELRLSAET